MKKEGYFKNNYNLFINSFKRIDLRIFFIAFFDLVFYFLVFLISITTFSIIQKKAFTISLPQNIVELGAENLEKMLVAVRAFYFLLIIMLILMFLMIIIDYSIFKGLAWGFTIKRKFNFKYFLRFFLLNLIWLSIFIVLAFLFSIIFNEIAFLIYLFILLLVWIYFTNIIYTLFVKKEDIKSILKAFKLGFTKIHYFILPYIILGIILLIIFFIMNLVIFLPYGIGLTIIILLLLFYLAWARFYIVEIVESF